MAIRPAACPAFPEDPRGRPVAPGHGVSAPLPEVLCAGSALWDHIARTEVPVARGADLPGRIRRQPGGVALNIALALARRGLRPAMLSAIGLDEDGEALVAALRAGGVDERWLHRGSFPTDQYLAIECPDGLVAGIADAHSLEATGASVLAPLLDGRLASAARPWPGPLVVDGNLAASQFGELATRAEFARADLRIIPASPSKAPRLRPLLEQPRVTLYANLAEAQVLCARRFDDAREAAMALLALGVRHALVSDGPRAAADANEESVIVRAPPEVQVRRVTGAGDTLLAAHVAAQLRGAGRIEAFEHALQAAARHVAGDDR